MASQEWGLLMPRFAQSREFANDAEPVFSQEPNRLVGGCVLNVILPSN